MKDYPSDLAEQFRKEVEGEVRFDSYSKVLYSTDASVWQMEPIGVVIPRHADDIVALTGTAARNQVPILARGGGTSLSGQTVGHAVQVDFAKYMNNILECNTEECWVRVQPGVVQDQLNNYLKPLGFSFGPDTSSSSRATIGGMIGNNSAGSHSIIHGKTIDHVLELKVVLSDGSEVVLGPVDDATLERLVSVDSLEGHIYRDLLTLGDRWRDEILERFPKLMRRVSGYNLDELVSNSSKKFGAGYSSSPGPLNLARMIVGSEGTLAVVSEAKVRIVPLPKSKGILVVQFRSLLESVEPSQEIVTHQPAAVELMDDFILNQARNSPNFSDHLDFVDSDAAAVMVVEFYGDSETEVRSKIERLKTHLERRQIGFGYITLTDPFEQQHIWQVRKQALGLLMSVKGDKKPIAFVEDPAVPIEHLPAFLKEFRGILESHDARGGYYGHASVGCLHVRPAIDLKQASEVHKMRQIGDEVCQLVMNFGGSMSGEHGDGIARGKFNQVLFGPEVYQAFVEAKNIFDPKNLMNPGKVVDAPEVTENLRLGADYQTINIKTHLDFSKEGGFSRAVEMCNGMGVCRKRDVGTMCPSYHATLEEEHSTRGRANALRAALSGALPPDELISKRMYDVLDLCLECKGCKHECPSNVDLAKIKYEFLAQYNEKYGVPLRAKIFAHVETLNRWGNRFASLANLTMGLRSVKWLIERVVGIDRRRQMPPFAPETFRSWFKKRTQTDSTNCPQVVLFDDCFTNYNYPQVGRAAAEVLEAAGFEVILAEKKCCGRPMISKGLLQDARQLAEDNVRSLIAYAEEGIPVVGCEPSCLLTFRDEYKELVSGPDVEKVAGNCYMIDEFLIERNELGELHLPFTERADQPRSVLFHGHCHQKAHIGSVPSLKAMDLVPHLKVSEVNSGCCGMAGSFGFEKEHYELSEKIGEQRLFPAVEAAGLETEIAVSGISCRQQIEHFTGRNPRHVIEVLRAALQK
ncbi:MAG: anaerobic glycerol-3-phosphate dehydrogenase subunit C [Solibacterales bacterium]|nr:anaerobic glycerol-3-phosphate dehydrogenase subunit C [Bryobacterales bacterium]|tara:strand:+ start:174 stop:3101 length:2928 start_codon:yes stop_codon:yes gene_type:complete